MRPRHGELESALGAALERAKAFLATLETRSPAAPFEAPAAIPLSEEGHGAVAAIDALWDRYGDAFSGSSGPRYWGFVNGGVTPAAMAADWLTAVVDQTGQMHGDSPGVAIEQEAIAMLRCLFGLPATFHGMFVSGGSIANYVGLAVGLQWVGRRFGVDVSREGIAAIPQVHLLTGECHASTSRAAGMLGLGRNAVERLPLEAGRERVCIDSMSRRLDELKGEPVIIVGNAGTVATGDFDDFEALANLAERYGAFFHVDGAFGLFGRLAPSCNDLVKGIERADTIASDAHKWLNVPYDSGFVFSRHLEAQNDMFKNESLYLPPPDPNPLNFPNLGPENSRRSRAIPAWTTLQAYGREGYKAFVEECIALVAELGERIEREEGFRLLATPRLNVLCFQPVADGRPFTADEVKAFNERLIADGRVRVSTTMFTGEPCIRLAILNWRTKRADLDIAMAAFRDCRAALLSQKEDAE